MFLGCGFRLVVLFGVSGCCVLLFRFVGILDLSVCFVCLFDCDLLVCLWCL